MTATNVHFRRAVAGTWPGYDQEKKTKRDGTEENEKAQKERKDRDKRTPHNERR